MMFGNIAVLFNVLSIMALSGLLVILTLTALIKLRWCELNQYSILSRRGLLWLIALSPWLVSLLASTLAILSGTQYALFPRSFDILHWHHAEEFMLNSWHGLSVVAAYGGVSILLLRKIYKLILNTRQINLLRGVAQPDDNGFYLLDTDAATAFTAGYLKPRCFITSGLRNQLSDDEFEIIQLHEKAHVRCSDPAKKWFFNLLTAFFPTEISRKLNQSMSLTMEQCADLSITRVISDKSLIAMTLLKVRRLSAAPIGNGLDNDLTCYYAYDQIEERIRYILNGTPLKSFPFMFTCLAAVSMSLVCALSVDIVHHLIEYTLDH